MKSIALITGVNIPLWVEKIVIELNKKGLRKVTLIRLLVNESKSKIPNFNIIKLLDKISGENSISYYPFKSSALKPDIEFNDVAELNDYLLSKSFDELVWCTNPNNLNLIQSNYKILFFGDIVTSEVATDITYMAYLKNASCTTFNLIERTGEGFNIVASAKIKTLKYSLKANRAKYSVLPWLIANYLNSKDIGNEIAYMPVGKNTSDLGESNLLLLLGKFYNFLNQKITARKQKYKWVLGVVNSSAFNHIEKKNVELIKAENGLGIADPFIVCSNNERVIFAEYIDEKWRGSIIAVRQKDGENKFYEILKEKYHLSYPYIFSWKNALYMVPESSENNEVALYKNVDFPLKWEKQKVLIDNIKLVDSTIFEKDNIWWLFANGKQYTNSFNEELFIFFADSPLGPWKPHKLNPVKIDISSSRPAGNIVIKEGKLLRPTQDCSERYGHKINWMDIEKLTESEFVENYYSEITPAWANGLVGTHNYSYWDDYVVIDGYQKQ